jgi:hypothetical protein
LCASRLYAKFWNREQGAEVSLDHVTRFLVLMCLLLLVSSCCVPCLYDILLMLVHDLSIQQVEGLTRVWKEH